MKLLVLSLLLLLPQSSPTSLTLTPVANGIRLNWTDSSTTERYLIERRVGRTGNWIGIYETTNASVRTYTDTTGWPNVEYGYRVHARLNNSYSSQGSATVRYASWQLAQPAPPPPPPLPPPPLPPPVNKAPIVSAGPDLDVTLPGPAGGFQLSGTVNDDGLPTGNALTYSWSKVLSPCPSTIANPASKQTSVSFTGPGFYTFRLTASDGVLVSTDDVNVNVSQSRAQNEEHMKPLLLASLLFMQVTATCQGGPAPEPQDFTYYVDFVGGADTNNGTSTATPFKHAPGMTGCTNTCASTTLVAGDSLAFKGGVTWTASFPWTLQGGTSGGDVTYGVDEYWYTGGSFTQPVFDDEGNENSIIDTTESYITVDNLKFVNCATAGVANAVQCLIFTNTNGITITDNTFICECWITIYMEFQSAGTYSDWTLTGNDFSSTASAMWHASGATGVVRENLVYNSNTFHDFTSQIGGTAPSGVHGDGALHSFSFPYTDATSYIDGLQFCNNKFYGDFRRSFGNDGGMTAFFKTAETATNVVICNNDFSYEPAAASIFQALIVMSGDSLFPVTAKIYNNSFAAIGVNAMSGAVNFGGLGTGSLITFVNNVVATPQNPVVLDDAATISRFSSNYNLLASSWPGFTYANGFVTWAQWQALGFDADSVFDDDPDWVSPPDDQDLQAGSPALDLGTNLTSEGISILNSDFNGVARPSVGDWDAGAYQGP